LEGATAIVLPHPTLARIYLAQLVPLFVVLEKTVANWKPPPLQNTRSLFGSETSVLPSE
jgi:hypothetical protein